MQSSFVYRLRLPQHSRHRVRLIGVLVASRPTLLAFPYQALRTVACFGTGCVGDGHGILPDGVGRYRARPNAPRPDPTESGGFFTE